MTIDLAAFTVNSDDTVTQALADATITGSAKLLQRVALELLTEQDSIPYRKGRGTLFLTYLKNRATTETDIFAAFAASQGTLTKNLQAEETSADPDSDRFASIRVGDIILASGKVSLRLTVSSRSGQAQKMLLPLVLHL